MSDVDRINVDLADRLNAELSARGFSLAYYRGAIDSALRECLAIETSLGVKSIILRTRLEQMQDLLRRLHGIESVSQENLRKLREPILCYVDGTWAYFTTQSLTDQWGDDWDDMPYEHNAEPPYEPCWHNLPQYRNMAMPDRAEPGGLCRCSVCVREWNDDGTQKWEIVKVAYDGDFATPCSNYCNSPFSVQKINSGAIAWLRSFNADSQIEIQAGTTISEFRRLVALAGGNVYLKT